jgi:hypothetical protein
MILTARLVGSRTRAPRPALRSALALAAAAGALLALAGPALADVTLTGRASRQQFTYSYGSGSEVFSDTVTQESFELNPPFDLNLDRNFNGNGMTAGGMPWDANLHVHMHQMLNPMPPHGPWLMGINSDGNSDAHANANPPFDAFATIDASQVGNLAELTFLVDGLTQYHINGDRDTAPPFGSDISAVVRLERRATDGSDQWLPVFSSDDGFPFPGGFNGDGLLEPGEYRISAYGRFTAGGPNAMPGEPRHTHWHFDMLFPCGAPSILRQPDAVAVCAGSDAVLTATGSEAFGAPSYQWRRGGVDLVDGPTGTGSTVSGSTSGTLTISGTTESDAGPGYSVQISSGCGMGSTSEAVAITIAPSCCPADFNGDSLLNPDDLSEFITCFFLELQFAGVCPAGDYNGDALLNPDDLSEFITTFFLALQFGC